MADEIWVDPEKLWALAEKINAETSTFAAAASGIGGLLGYLPDAVRNRLGSYMPTAGELQSCADDMYDLATFLQRKAMAFAYLDGYDYFAMEGGGPSLTDVLSLDSSMFAGSMFSNAALLESASSVLADFLHRVTTGVGYGATLALALGWGVYASYMVRGIAISEQTFLSTTLTDLAVHGLLPPGTENIYKTDAYLAFKGQYKSVGGTAGKVAAGIGFAIDLSLRVASDWDRYDGTEFGVSVGFDIAESAGVTAAGYWGGVGGAALGSLICPGVGTVIGGIVGSVAAGWVASYAFDRFDESELKRDIVGGIADGLGASGECISNSVSWAGDKINSFCDSLW